MKKILASILVLVFQISAWAAGPMILKVEGMTCGGCEHSVEDQVQKIPGVKSCKADHKSGMVKIETDGTTLVTEEALSVAVSKAGKYKIITSQSP